MKRKKCILCPGQEEEEEIRLIMEDMDRIDQYLDRVAQQSDDLTEKVKEFVEEFYKNQSPPPPDS